MFKTQSSNHSEKKHIFTPGISALLMYFLFQYYMSLKPQKTEATH